MTLTFLGTAATEGVPAVFCNCATCQNAKLKGGRDIRTRSQILIDNDVLFDFPMDTYLHMLRFKLDLSEIRRVLITHAHMDHCYPQEFCMRGAPFAHGLKQKKLDLYCNDSVRKIYLADTSREMRPEVAADISVNVLRPFERVIKPDMSFIAVPSVHTKGENCFVYYVERNGSGALLLNDTGTLDEDVYKKLKDMGVMCDGITLDCTYGAVRHGSGRHMGLFDNVDQIELMKKVGIVKDGAQFVATHFSHNTDLDYEGMVRVATPLGITIAYDGLQIVT